MENNYTNIYQRFRCSAGYTQEKASELICKSVESLKAYENDRTLPSDDTVLAMVNVYNAPQLAIMHLSNSVLGKKIVPKLSEKSLSEAIISLDLELADLMDKLHLLKQIGRDNKITKDEMNDFTAVLKEAKDVANAISDLEFSVYTKED